MLDNIGFGSSSVGSCLRGLGAILTASYAFTYLSLLRQKPSDKPFWKYTDRDKGESTREDPTIISAEAASDGEKDEGSNDVATITSKRRVEGGSWDPPLYRPGL